jgi:hypothetical protein
MNEKEWRTEFDDDPIISDKEMIQDIADHFDDKTRKEFFDNIKKGAEESSDLNIETVEAESLKDIPDGYALIILSHVDSSSEKAVCFKEWTGSTNVKKWIPKSVLLRVISNVGDDDVMVSFAAKKWFVEKEGLKLKGRNK